MNNNLKPVETLRPFTRFCMTIGALPSSYLISMTYEEQLLWFCNYLEKTVIPTLNNNALAVEELQNLFLQLQEYVNNYFENLDIQEEINNKLDEMALDGTLENLISQYIQLATTYVYDTVSDMKQATNLIDGCYARTSGYHTYNDGGGIFYKIRTITNEDVVDEKKIIALSDENLIAEIVIDNSNLYPEKFGAYGDNIHDDSEVIQYLINNYKFVKFYNKTYLVHDIYVDTNVALIGDKTIFNGVDRSNNGLLLYKTNIVEPIRYVELKGITLLKYNIGLFAIDVNHSQFNEIICDQCNTGAIFTGRTWTCKFYNCIFKNNQHNGLEVGILNIHPTLQTPLEISPATFDFHSCEFSNNIEWAFYGYSRVFNFIGGYAQGNRTGAFKFASTNDLRNAQTSFIGFDVEEENIGIMVMNPDNDECHLEYLNIVGGQWVINEMEEDSDTITALLYLKGSSINKTYNHNINIQARSSCGGIDEDGLEPYVVYCDYTSGNPSIEINVNLGNNNNSYFKSNLTSFLPTGTYKNNEIEIDLNMFIEYFDGTNVVIPAEKSIYITIPHLEYINDLWITTSDNSINVQGQIYGYKTDHFERVGSANATTLTDNVANIHLGGNCNLIKLINRSSNSLTITAMKYSGFIKR